MRYAYSVETIRRVESRATQDLMARAAFAIASRAADLLSDIHGGVYGSQVLLLVGPGSNGGDALLAGAHLMRRGAQVRAWLSDQRFHESAMEVFLAAGGSLGKIEEPDLIIDGIVGMGSKGALALLPDLPDAFVLAIDLPSGVHPDTGEIDGLHIRADLTLATGAYKAAHFIDPAHDACGIVELIDLGLDFTGEAALCESWQGDDVADFLGSISIDGMIADKYRKGVVGLVAGSKVYPGAGILCADAAIAAGAGMIRLYSDADIRSERPEVVAADGQCQSLVVGPGLVDFDVATEMLLREIPAVVDAGAIEHLQPGRRGTVITPHAGELARLLKVERTWVEDHRLEAAQRASLAMDCIVVLKGSTTIIAATDAVAVNPTGTDALATAGAGDVLAGLLGTFLARGAEIFDAAVAAAWIHGVAGSYAESSASAIAEIIPAAIEGIRQY